MLRFALLASLITAPAFAEEATLRAISAFRPGTTFYPPFEVGNALRGGVVDMALTTAVFHANLSPEGLAMTLTAKPIEELRANGGYDMLNAIQEQKAGIHWLGRTIDHVPYHIYLAQMPDAPDFEGLKLRSTPVYQAFFRALGAAPVQTALGEVYTALERGVVDGYGWPAIGIFDEGWQEKTAARVEPGFYSTEVGIYLSKRSWDGLDDAQREFMRAQMAKIEARNADYIDAGEAERSRLNEAGVEFVEMDDDAAAAFRDQAMQTGWDALIAASPDHGPALRAKFE